MATQPRYHPAQQLDMFAPVQLGFGIDPAPLRHLSEQEAITLAEIIHNKYGYSPIIELGEAIEPYHLDSKSTQLVINALDYLAR